MATKLGICNRALIKLGVEPLDSLSSDKKEAILCNTVYDDVLEAMFNDHKWNCSIRRAAATLLATTPDNEWHFEYQLPTDCVRVLSVGNSSADVSFAVEYNNVLRTNSQTANIKYISNNVAEGNFSRSLAEAVAWSVASELCYALIQDKGILDRITKEAENRIIDYRNRDAQEGTPEQFFPDTWMSSRHYVENEGPDALVDPVPNSLY